MHQHQDSHIHIALPDWLPVVAGRYQASLAIHDRMRLVLDASRENIARGTGGPFAAGVFEHGTGNLVALGVNLVTTQGLSTLHAEMVALMLAQRRLETFNLGAANLPQHELVCSTEPCAMCFGALPWSGIRYLVTGARDEDARAIGFDEGPKFPDWPRHLEERGIQVQSDILRSEAVETLQQYRRQQGVIYNP